MGPKDTRISFLDLHVVLSSSDGLCALLAAQLPSLPRPGDDVVGVDSRDIHLSDMLCNGDFDQVLVEV